MMNAAQHLLVTAIRFYRLVLSPAKLFLLGAHARCRFTPACSAYALEAVVSHGALAGSWLAVKRVCRCHPWGGCGEDLVPALEPKNAMRNSKMAEGLESGGSAFFTASSSPGPALSGCQTNPWIAPH